MSSELSRQSKLGEQISQAIGLNADHARVEALRRVALRLHRDDHASTTAKALVLATLHRQSLSQAFLALRDLSFTENVDELTVIRYMEAGDEATTICVIAHLAHLPVDVADRLFAIDERDILLVVCRAQNFAWSTMRKLLALRHPESLTPERLNGLCDDYHAMPLSLAERFGRFLRAHFDIGH